MNNVSFEKVFYNERDVEIPLVERFISKHLDKISSVLDFGAHYSSKYYAKNISNILYDRTFDGIDLLQPCNQEERLLFDLYFVDNILNLKETYDYIISVSTLEHSGITTYQSNSENEQYTVFEKLCFLALRGIFLTFPFGQSFKNSEFRNITDDDLCLFSSVAIREGFEEKYSFYYNENPAFSMNWEEITRKEAINKIFDSKYGCRCICIAEFLK